MNYTIEIYLYDNKLIFTGTRDLYLKNIKETDRLYTLSLFCVYQVAALFQKFSKLS